MIIEFPNSPGVPITIERGGTDPVTGEEYSDQFVQLSWDVTTTAVVTDPETGEQSNVETTHTERRGFLGPEA